jgi:hypothetical protein
MHVFWLNGGLVWWPDSPEEAAALDANTKDLQTGRPKELEPASPEEIAEALGVEDSLQARGVNLGIEAGPLALRDASHEKTVIRIHIPL